MSRANRPTLTVGLANYGVGFGVEEWRLFLDTCRAADNAGVDRLVVVDHVVMGSRTDAYAWGRFPVPPDAPWLEPLTTLAAVAAVTSKLRLATGILIAPLRPPALLAKTVATLDLISHGRVDLGVGTGWQQEEYDAVGADFANRGQLLTDTMAACKVLWRDSPASFESSTVSFDEVWCEPKPVQPGGVPIWIAGTLHSRSLDRIVRIGDGWIPIMGETIEGIRSGVGRIAEAWVGAGRQGASPEVRATLPVVSDGRRADLTRSLEQVPRLVEAGATDIHVNLRSFCAVAADQPEVVATLAQEFAAAAR